MKVRAALADPERLSWHEFARDFCDRDEAVLCYRGPDRLADALVRKSTTSDQRNRLLDVLRRHPATLRAFAETCQARRGRPRPLEIAPGVLLAYLRTSAAGAYLAVWLDREHVEIRCDAIRDELLRLVVRVAKGADDPLRREGMRVWVRWAADAVDEGSSCGSPGGTDSGPGAIRAAKIARKRR
jgi:hypothetical protein